VRQERCLSAKQVQDRQRADKQAYLIQEEAGEQAVVVLAQALLAGLFHLAVIGCLQHPSVEGFADLAFLLQPLYFTP